MKDEDGEVLFTVFLTFLTFLTFRNVENMSPHFTKRLFINPLFIKMIYQKNYFHKRNK